MNETLAEQDKEKGSQGQGLMKTKVCVLNVGGIFWHFGNYFYGGYFFFFFLQFDKVKVP